MVSLEFAKRNSSEANDSQKSVPPRVRREDRSPHLLSLTIGEANSRGEYIMRSMVTVQSKMLNVKFLYGVKSTTGESTIWHRCIHKRVSQVTVFTQDPWGLPLDQMTQWVQSPDLNRGKSPGYTKSPVKRNWLPSSCQKEDKPVDENSQRSIHSCLRRYEYKTFWTTTKSGSKATQQKWIHRWCENSQLLCPHNSMGFSTDSNDSLESEQIPADANPGRKLHTK